MPEDINVTLEILEYNYWEHFKALKDVSLILPIDHPKRISLQMSIDELLKKINKIKNS